MFPKPHAGSVTEPGLNPPWAWGPGSCQHATLTLIQNNGRCDRAQRNRITDKEIETWNDVKNIISMTCS